jgi:hypothetical protein
VPRRRWLTIAILATLVACGGGSTPSATPHQGASPDSTASEIPGGSDGTGPSDADLTPEPLPMELVLGQTFGLFYDPILEGVVLVNGATEDGPVRPTELWRWDGAGWELLDTAGPQARSFAAVGRDPERGVVVVHGGIGSGGDAFDETLEWDGRDWSVTTAPGPGAREGAGIAYDAEARGMVLFGGASDGEQLPDTWSWNGTEWERIAEAGPRPRFVSLMTEDRSTDGILLQGGHWVDGNDGDFLADTWRWSDGAWIEVTNAGGPGPRVNSPGAWDDRLGGIAMFGGGTGIDTPHGADTWLWTDAWAAMTTVTAPSPRNGHALAYDVKREVLVLVGGIARPGGSQQLDVWELGPDGWRQVWPRA